eukprot:SAG31_NODE_31_length_32474_cov_18.308139_9_plen_4647_part_00
MSVASLQAVIEPSADGVMDCFGKPRLDPPSMTLVPVGEGRSSPASMEPVQNPAGVWGTVRGPKIVVSSDGSLATDVSDYPQEFPPRQKDSSDMDMLERVDGESSMCSYGRYRVVVANGGVSSGCHTWHVQVNTPGSFLVGICTQNVRGNWDESNKQSLDKTPDAWVVKLPSDGSSAKMCHAGTQRPSGLSVVRAGSVIGITLDCDVGVVVFTVNGRRGNLSYFDGLPVGEKLCVAACFGGDETPSGSLRMCMAQDPEALWTATTPATTASGLSLRQTYYLLNQHSGLPLHCHAKGDRLVSERYDRTAGGRRGIESQWMLEYACQYTRASSIYYIRNMVATRAPLHVNGTGDMLLSTRFATKPGQDGHIVHGFGGFGDEYAQFKVELSSHGRDDLCHYLRNVATGLAVSIDDKHFASNVGDIEDDRAQFNFEDTTIFHTLAYLKQMVGHHEDQTRSIVQEFVASVLVEHYHIESRVAVAAIKIGQFTINDLINCLHRPTHSILTLFERVCGSPGPNQSDTAAKIMTLLLREAFQMMEPFAGQISAALSISGSGIVRCLLSMKSRDIVESEQTDASPILQLILQNVREDGAKFRPILEAWAAKQLCDRYDILAKTYEMSKSVDASTKECGIIATDLPLGAKVVSCAALNTTDIVNCLATPDTFIALLQRCSNKQKQAIIGQLLAQKIQPAQNKELDAAVQVAVRDISSAMTPLPEDILPCLTEPGVETIISIAKRDALQDQAATVRFAKFRPILEAYMSRVMTLLLTDDELLSTQLVEASKLPLDKMLDFLSNVQAVVDELQNIEEENLRKMMAVLFCEKIHLGPKFSHAIASAMALTGSDVVNCIGAQNQHVDAGSRPDAFFQPGIDAIIAILKKNIGADMKKFRPILENFYAAVLTERLGFAPDLSAELVACGNFDIYEMADHLAASQNIVAFAAKVFHDREQHTVANMLKKLNQSEQELDDAFMSILSKATLPRSRSLTTGTPSSASLVPDTTPRPVENHSTCDLDKAPAMQTGSNPEADSLLVPETANATTTESSNHEKMSPSVEISAVNFAALFLSEKLHLAPELAARIIQCAALDNSSILAIVQTQHIDILEAVCLNLVDRGLTIIPSIVTAFVNQTDAERSELHISTDIFAAVYLAEANSMDLDLAKQVVAAADFSVSEVLDCLEFEEGIAGIFKKTSVSQKQRLVSVMARLLRQRIINSMTVITVDGLVETTKLSEEIATIMKPKAADVVACINDSKGDTIFCQAHGVHRATTVFGSVCGRNLKEAKDFLERACMIYLTEIFEQPLQPEIENAIGTLGAATLCSDAAQSIVQSIQTMPAQAKGGMVIDGIEYRHCIWQQGTPGMRTSGKYTMKISDIQLLAAYSTSIFITARAHAATCRNIYADADPDIESSPWCACHYSSGTVLDHNQFFKLREGVTWPLNCLVAGQSFSRLPSPPRGTQLSVGLPVGLPNDLEAMSMEVNRLRHIQDQRELKLQQPLVRPNLEPGVDRAVEPDSEFPQQTSAIAQALRAQTYTVTPEIADETWVASQNLSSDCMCSDQACVQPLARWLCCTSGKQKGLFLGPGRACEFEYGVTVPIEVWLGGDRTDLLSLCLRKPQYLAPLMSVALKRSDRKVIMYFLMMIFNKMKSLTLDSSIYCRLAEHIADEIIEDESELNDVRVTAALAMKCLTQVDSAIMLLQPSIIRWILVADLEVPHAVATQLACVVSLTAEELTDCLHHPAHLVKFVLDWASRNPHAAQKEIVPMYLSAQLHLPKIAAMELVHALSASSSAVDILSCIKGAESGSLDPLHALLTAWAAKQSENNDSYVSIVMSSKIDERAENWQCSAPRVRISNESKPSQTALRVVAASQISTEELTSWLLTSGDLLQLLDQGTRVTDVLVMMLQENLRLSAEDIDFYFVQAMNLNVRDVIRFLTDPGKRWSTLLKYAGTEARSAIVNRVFVQKLNMIPSIAEELAKARRILIDDVVDCLSDGSHRMPIISKLRYLSWSHFCSTKRVLPAKRCMDYGCDSCAVIVNLTTKIQRLLVNVVQVWKKKSPLLKLHVVETFVQKIVCFQLQRGHMSMLLEGQLEAVTKLILQDQNSELVDQLINELRVVLDAHGKYELDSSSFKLAMLRTSSTVGGKDSKGLSNSTSIPDQKGCWNQIEHMQLRRFWSDRLPKLDKVTPMFLIDKLERAMLAQPDMFGRGKLALPLDERSSELLRQVLSGHTDDFLTLDDSASERIKAMPALSLGQLSKLFPVHQHNIGDCLVLLMKEADESWAPAAATTAAQLLQVVLCDRIHMPEPLAIDLSEIVAPSYRLVAELQTSGKQELINALPKLLAGKTDRVIELITKTIKPMFQCGLQIDTKFAIELSQMMMAWESHLEFRQFVSEVAGVVKEILCEKVRQELDVSAMTESAIKEIRCDMKSFGTSELSLILQGRIEELVESILANVKEGTRRIVVQLVQTSLRIKVEQQFVKILALDRKTAELVSKKLSLSSRQRLRVAEGDLLRVVSELAMSQYFRDDEAEAAAAKLCSAKEQAKTAAAEAYALGCQDKEMPEGTIVRVPQRGEGIIQGFTRNIIGKNEYTIQFLNTRQKEQITLHNVEGWTVTPDFEKYGVMALEATSSDIGKIIADAVVATVLLEKRDIPRDYAIRMSRIINLTPVKVLECLVDPVKVRVLNLLYDWTGSSRCTRVIDEIRTLVGQLLRENAQKLLAARPKEAVLKALEVFSIDSDHVAMFIDGQWESMLSAVWPDLLAQFDLQELIRMFPGSDIEHAKYCTVLPRCVGTSVTQNVRTGLCISGYSGAQTLCSYCHPSSHLRGLETKNQNAVESLDAVPGSPFIPAVVVDLCPPMFRALITLIHEFHHLGSNVRLNYQQCRAFSRQLQHVERMLASTNESAPEDIQENPELGHSISDTISAISEIIAKAVDFALSLTKNGFLKRFFMYRSDDTKLLILSQQLNQQLQSMHVCLLLNASLESDASEFSADIRANEELRRRVHAIGGICGIRPDDADLMTFLTCDLPIDSRTFQEEMKAIAQAVQEKHASTLAQITPGPWDAIGNLQIRHFWYERIKTQECATEIFVVQLYDWLRTKVIGRPSLRAVVEQLGRFGATIPTEKLCILKDILQGCSDRSIQDLANLGNGVQPMKAVEAARILLHHWKAYVDAELAVASISATIDDHASLVPISSRTSFEQNEHVSQTNFGHEAEPTFEPDLLNLDLDKFPFDKLAGALRRPISQGAYGLVNVRDMHIFTSTLGLGDQMNSLVNSDCFRDESGFFSEEVAPMIPPRGRYDLFSGRLHELHQIRQWLHKKTEDIISIYGSSGSGKTTLLVEAAWREHIGQHCEFWRGGIVFVDISGQMEATAIRSAIISAAGGHDDDQDSLREVITRQNSCGRLPKLRLLLLDNVEIGSQIKQVLNEIYEIKPFSDGVSADISAENIRIVMSTQRSLSAWWKTDSDAAVAKKLKILELNNLSDVEAVQLLSKRAPSADREFLSNSNLRVALAKKTPGELVMIAPLVANANSPERQESVLNLLKIKSSFVDAVIDGCLKHKDTQPLLERFTNIPQQVSLFRPVRESNYFRTSSALTYANDDAEKRRRRLAKVLGLSMRAFAGRAKANKRVRDSPAIPVDLYCEACDQSALSLASCTGKLSASGAPRSSAASKRSPDVDVTIAEGDASALAVHIWTFSRPLHGDAVFKKINRALLKDDPVAIHELAPVMEAIRCWIYAHPSPRDVILYRGTPIGQKQQHPMGNTPMTVSSRAGRGELDPDLVEQAARSSRMPMFVAASTSRQKAQEFCKPGCPILEFVVPVGCRNCTPLGDLSHFPEDEEWLMPPYTAVRFVRQRVEMNMRVGTGKNVRTVDQLIVTYEVLDWEQSLKDFENAGQPLKSCLVMCDMSSAEKPKLLPEIHASDLRPAKIVRFEVTFPGDELPTGTAKGALCESLVAEVSALVGVPLEDVSVDNMREPGGIIVSMSVRVPEQNRIAMRKARTLKSIVVTPDESGVDIPFFFGDPLVSLKVDEVFTISEVLPDNDQIRKDLLSLCLVTPKGATFDAEMAGIIATSTKEQFTDVYLDCAGEKVLVQLDVSLGANDLLDIRFAKMKDATHGQCAAVVDIISKHGVTANHDKASALKRGMVLGYVDGVPLTKSTRFSTLMSQLGCAVKIKLGFVAARQDWKLTMAGSERREQAFVHGDRLISELAHQNLIESPIDGRFRLTQIVHADIAGLNLATPPAVEIRYARYFLGKLATICSLISSGEKKAAMHMFDRDRLHFLRVLSTDPIPETLLNDHIELGLEGSSTVLQKSSLIIYELLFSKLELSFVVSYYERLRDAVQTTDHDGRLQLKKNQSQLLISPSAPSKAAVHTAASRWRKARTVVLTVGRLEFAAAKRQLVRDEIARWEAERRSRGDPAAAALADTINRMTRCPDLLAQSSRADITTPVFNRRSTIEIVDPSSPFFRQRATVRKTSANNRILSVAFTGSFGAGLPDEEADLRTTAQLVAEQVANVRSTAVELVESDLNLADMSMDIGSEDAGTALDDPFGRVDEVFHPHKLDTDSFAFFFRMAKVISIGQTVYRQEPTPLGYALDRLSTEMRGTLFAKQRLENEAFEVFRRIVDANEKALGGFDAHDKMLARMESLLYLSPKARESATAAIYALLFELS